MPRSDEAADRPRTPQQLRHHLAAAPLLLLQLWAVASVAAAAAAAAAAPGDGASGGGSAACYRSLSRTDFPHCQQLGPGFALHWRVDGSAASAANGSSTGGNSTAAAAEWQQRLAAPRGAITLGLDVDTGGGRMRWVGQPQTVIWAYGRAWPTQHVAKGNALVTFLPPPGPPGAEPAPDRLWQTLAGEAAAAAGSGTAAASPAGPIGSSSGAGSGSSSRNTSSPGAVSSQPALREQVAALFSARDAGGSSSSSNGSAGSSSSSSSGSTAGNDDGDSDDNDGLEPGATANGQQQQQQRAGLQVVSVRMPRVAVPANATTSYLCVHTSLPAARKQHIVSYTAHVRSPLIHHMILFACERPPPAALAAVLAGGGANNSSGSSASGNSSSGNSSSGSNGRMLQQRPVGPVYECLATAGGQGCNTFYIGAWRVVGMAAAVVGLPVGLVHYNNPDGQAGVVDDSGFDIAVTPERYSLRPSVCPAGCTARHLARGPPLRLLGSGLHAHTLGRAVSTRHFRNLAGSDNATAGGGGSATAATTVELPPVGSRHWYQFDYQAQDPVPDESALLLPGDTLLTGCSYDSSGRTNVTRFGESTQDEMCFNFVLYYPRLPSLVTCAALDAAGDPGLALCGGWADTDAVGAVLRALRGQQQQQLPGSGSSSSSSSSNSSSSNGGRLDVFIGGASPNSTNEGANGTAATVAGHSSVRKGAAAANLAAVPTLAPFFASGVLVPLAPQELAAAAAALAAESPAATSNSSNTSNTSGGSGSSANTSDTANTRIAAFGGSGGGTTNLTDAAIPPFFTYLSPDLTGAACPDMEWGMSWGQRQQLLAAALAVAEAAETEADTDGGSGAAGADVQGGDKGAGDGDEDDEGKGKGGGRVDP
ncbi:hypothetical protein HXX76_008495 [Chlamydomonas incerta]|uniref:DOMON domain-containing protein n=1 Tax=Chlamydomonas incerta TaxID=51695 RepID=A0A835W171_CHLIN|nr:hypothetical protein HXX76_008495 [Chlamydomonas incerta]|eukprot:KAG2433438.1 hypothetical protein HXX76_008495 [Chlamydomonas incerta]